MAKAEVFKYIAFGAMGMYLYQQFKEDPHALGNAESVNGKAHKFIDVVSSHVNVHPKVNNVAKYLATGVINDKMNRQIRDVTPKDNDEK